ncbi:hypothetical protein QR680_007636 [Steinernema hermaphroditum]|uniref:Uncharacterized protein n=1 Tax=Steinernema hermaphroditum TaxID=289476 RepID=A0AA39M6Q7_9BILA|nr:hypothetical protein QR680_007636 [Steinernema hermaphroditum]
MESSLCVPHAVLIPVVTLWTVLIVMVIGLVIVTLVISRKHLRLLERVADESTFKPFNTMSASYSMGYSPFRSRRSHLGYPPSSRRVSPRINPGNVTWPSSTACDGSAMLNSSFESPRSRFTGKTPKTPRSLRLPLSFGALKAEDEHEPVNMNETPTRSIVIDEQSTPTPTKKNLRERGDALLMMGGYAYGSGTPSRRFLQTVIEDRETEFCG